MGRGMMATLLAVGVLMMGSEAFAGGPAGTASDLVAKFRQLG